MDKTLPKAEDNKQADEKIVPLFLVLAQTINVGSSIINQTTDTITQAQAPVVSLNYEIYNESGEIIKQGKTYMNPMFKTTPAYQKNTDHLHLDNIEMPEGATTAKVWLSRELDVEQANNLNSENMVVYYDDYQIVNQYDPYQPFYRYGFQGQERDDEIKGKGNSLNYTYRMHDPRLGRFFAVDPLTGKYPYYSPYAFSGNMVVHAVELEGLEPNPLFYIAEGFRRIGQAIGSLFSFKAKNSTKIKKTNAKKTPVIEIGEVTFVGIDFEVSSNLEEAFKNQSTDLGNYITVDVDIYTGVEVEGTIETPVGSINESSSVEVHDDGEVKGTVKTEVDTKYRGVPFQGYVEKSGSSTEGVSTTSGVSAGSGQNKVYIENKNSSKGSTITVGGSVGGTVKAGKISVTNTTSVELDINYDKKED